MKKILTFILTIFFAFSSSFSTIALANEVDYKVKNIERLIQQIDNEEATLGEASESTILQLEKELNDLGIVTKKTYSGTNVIMDSDDILSGFGFRYGQFYNAGQGWTFRVDAPRGNSKPHAHVYHKGREVGTENCDGTRSHGRDFSRVPKKIRDKVRNSKDYKKGKKDIENYKKAKKEIQNRRLNLRINKDLLIAAGIIVTFVGVAYFAPYYIPGFLALI